MYIWLNIYTYIHIYNERKNKIVLISLSEGTTGDGRSKENFREWKILKQHIYIWLEYNVMHCTISCWILGEHGGRK
jgi:hypothetical protein